MTVAITFPDLLRKHLEKSCVTQRRFAESCGVSQALVQSLLVGRTHPAPDKLPAMADALGLSGDERDAFVTAGHLAHSTDKIREEYEYLAAQVQVIRRHRLGRILAIRGHSHASVGEAIGVQSIAVSMLCANPMRDLELLSRVCAHIGIEPSFVIDGVPVPPDYAERYENALAEPALEYQAQEQARIKKLRNARS